MADYYLSEARAACERQFAFLVTEFGYRRVRRRFKWNGFELRYRGPSVGVAIEWYPRDPLAVLLAVLVDGDFPDGDDLSESGGHTYYFSVHEVASLTSARLQLDPAQLYELPSDTSAGAMAKLLRDCGSTLLRGDLSLLPQLEQQSREQDEEYEKEITQAAADAELARQQRRGPPRG